MVPGLMCEMRFICRCSLQITPTQFHQTINDINEILISAHSIHRSFVDNFLAVVTLQLSTLMTTSHYTKVSDRP